ncbi:MAG: phosphate transport system protein [Candidatus Binatota bacterium]|jgi:phosphate transport system protein|nr:phosphate transport system protein [Candidatus Binatota bacterium]
MPEHTDRHFELELQNLQELILRMGGLVEAQISRAIDSLVERDSEQAREVIAGDREVNQLDIAIDELCLKLLALHQPAAGDLRFITTGLKITTDLERIGDQAVNVCERALELNEEPQLKPYIDVPRLAAEATTMVRESLDAFVRRDTQLASNVCLEDDVVDALYEQIFRELLSYMAENPRTITRATRILFVAKYLERIADHATNIAEMVIFMVNGKMIRHAQKLPPTNGS